jgi:hypothetical protein
MNKSFKFIALILIAITFYSCNTSSDKNTVKKIENLEKLKKEPKFVETAFYPGLEKKESQSALSNLLNDCVDDFIKGAKKNISDSEYQDLMKKNLKKFDVYNLDTEDREYICGYFEKIMDAIELESSGGVLNQWLYGSEF